MGSSREARHAGIMQAKVATAANVGHGGPIGKKTTLTKEPLEVKP
jgi:hypothetical protein